jgi:16S rRNA (cytidine1402-2'-O)-methyltransferase
VIRELTKIHEEIIRGTISEVLQQLKSRTVKGEIVIVIEGKSDKNQTDTTNE